MFYALDEYPCLGSKGLSPYPDEWDDQQDMSPTRVRFTPATGALSGVDTWFEYYRGLNDLISAGGKAQIGVRTAAVATFNGYNFDPQRAANPVIAYDAVASLPVLGGLYNDFRAVVYNSKIRLFIAIYGNPSGSNRTAIFESADGFTFTYVGEAQKDATYLGRTIGALANVSGTLVSLVSIADGAGGGNGRQKWISTDGGLTWLDRGLAIHVGDEGDWNGLNYVGGTMQLEGDYYVALLPGMPFIGNDGGGDPYLDWPEAVGAFRIPAASILNADVLWEANSSNPLIIAGPTHNALWHMALFEDRGTTYSTVETWGVPGFENIGTATTRALRTTPYYGTESRVSSSQLYELKMTSRHWLDNWTAPVVADGTYTLRHVQSGKFVSVVDGQPVLTEAGTIAEFSVERELSFYTISNADLCLSAIDDLMQTGFEFVENPGALDNVLGQWWIMPWEDRPADQPQLVVLTNRYSRLAASLPRDTETEGAPLVQAPFLGHASMVFELAPVVRAETTTEFPDPENPLLNKDLPSGDLVGTTASQVLTNKALALPTRAAFVALNNAGKFADMQNGWVVEADGLGYRRVAASTVISDLHGWVPHGDLSILQFASETVLSADAQPAINAMLTYAATLVEDAGLTLSRNGFSGKVKASLANRSWLVSSRVDMSQCAGVELCDGTLEANTATWPSPSTYVLRFGGINNNNNRYMGLRNVVVRCNRVANGILAENLQNSFADDVFIHGQTQYGWRKIGPKAGGCRMRNIRANEWFTSEAGYDEKANRTSIGISNECADETYENCEGVLCLINISLSGTGAHVFRQSHPFHGVMADLSTYTITGAVSDGATGTRCTVAATTGLSNGDLVVMPWINGISGEGGTGGRPGSYVISNVTGTTFDAAAYVFAGSFTGDDTPNVTIWSEERVNLLINSDVSVADIDIEADNGKIKIVQDAAGSPRVKLRVLAAGLSANNARCAVELVADGVEADFAGVQVDIHTESSGYRLTAINGGTFADPIAAQVNEFRTDRASRSTALLSVGHGTATKPSLRFSGLDGGGAISTDATTGFFAHSDHTPALTANDEEKLHFSADALIPKNGYAIANTMTITELTTAADAGAYDGLPDGAEIIAGGCAFAKLAGAAYTGLPVGFVPVDAVPEHFGAVGDKITDDAVALQGWLTFLANSPTTSHGTLCGIYGVASGVAIPTIGAYKDYLKITGLHLNALAGFPAATFMLELRGTGLTITNCTFVGNQLASGIDGNDVSRLILTNNHFLECLDYCFYSPSVSQDSIFSHNHFRGKSGAPYIMKGIWIGGGADLMITENVFQWTEIAIHVTSGGTQIIGNHIYQGQGGGTELLPMMARPDGVGIWSKGKNVVIANNYLDKCTITFEVVLSQGASNGGQIVNNLFYTAAVYTDDDAFILLNGYASGVFRNLIITGNNFHNNDTGGAASTPNLIPIRATGVDTTTPIDRATALIGANRGILTDNEQPTYGTAAFGNLLLKAPLSNAAIKATNAFDTASLKVEGSRTGSMPSSFLMLADRDGSTSMVATETDLRYFKFTLWGDTLSALGTLRLSCSIPGSATETGLLRFTQTAVRPETDGLYDLGTTGYRFGAVYGNQVRLRGALATGPHIYTAPTISFSNSQIDYVGNRTAGGTGVLSETRVLNNITGTDVVKSSVQTLADGSTVYYVDGVEIYRIGPDGVVTSANSASMVVFQKLASDRVLTSTTDVQAMFAVGAVSVRAGVYEFSAQIICSGMSAVSGNLGFTALGAGTAVLGSYHLQSSGSDSGALSTNSALSGRVVDSPSITNNLSLGNTGTTYQGVVRGTLEVTTAGTLIPSIALADASAATLVAGSSFTMRRLGATAMIGAWA